MSWLPGIPHIYAILHVGTIICWGIGIVAGTEYLSKKWPAGNRILGVVMGLGFFFALVGEYGIYRYDVFRDPGVQATQRFQAMDANKETFTVSHDPIPSSLEVLINGLSEAEDVYSVQGRAITVLTRLTNTDVVTVKYRYRSE